MYIVGTCIGGDRQIILFVYAVLSCVNKREATPAHVDFPFDFVLSC